MNEQIQRNLNLTIRMEDDHFEVDVYEPESGEVSQFEFPYSFEHPEFDSAIGAEIYSWLSLWKDAQEDSHG